MPENQRADPGHLGLLTPTRGLQPQSRVNKHQTPACGGRSASGGGRGGGGPVWGQGTSAGPLRASPTPKPECLSSVQFYIFNNPLSKSSIKKTNQTTPHCATLSGPGPAGRQRRGRWRGGDHSAQHNTAPRPQPESRGLANAGQGLGLPGRARGWADRWASEALAV